MHIKFNESLTIHLSTCIASYSQFFIDFNIFNIALKHFFKVFNANHIPKRKNQRRVKSN